jgi:Uma2 family endonuclease
MSEPARPLTLPQREGARSWPAQGRWTYDDYCLLPDDGQRYEVIRGFLYVSPAPSTDHQRCVVRLFRRLDRFAGDHGLGEVFSAPYDILLPRGIATPIQPDLMFFRTGNEPRPGTPNFQGVPDLVLEVLSPSTCHLDTRVKLAAYRDAGVPEVWLADPQARTITVHGRGQNAKSYVELSRGGPGDSVTSHLLPGLRIEISEIFPT